MFTFKEVVVEYYFLLILSEFSVCGYWDFIPDDSSFMFFDED